MYIADLGNNRIRKVAASTGIITTIAGTGSSGYDGDNGAATSAKLHGPHDVTLDSGGNVYIIDRVNNVIRKVTTSTGIISAYIGGGSYDDDGVAATSADIDHPCYGRFDGSSNFYFSEFSGEKIRKVSTPQPSYIPTVIPTVVPTIVPTTRPTAVPTTTPSVVPTVIPTIVPTAVPSVTPSTMMPTAVPTVVPTAVPSVTPSTMMPTAVPTVVPTVVPSVTPSTLMPTIVPTVVPTVVPSIAPSTKPTADPTTSPSVVPTVIPTIVPTAAPTTVPTKSPSVTPSTLMPTVLPTAVPSIVPTTEATADPTTTPSVSTTIPSVIPPATPSVIPTVKPSTLTATPTSISTVIPLPSTEPTADPSTTLPSLSPILSALNRPTGEPTSAPSAVPSSSPTKISLVLINSLTTSIDKKLVAEKARYYLAIYIGYFFFVFLILLMIDKSKFGKNDIDRLLASAHSSAMYVPLDDSINLANFTSREKDSAILRDLQKKDKILVQMIEDERVRQQLNDVSICKHSALHVVDEGAEQKNGVEMSTMTDDKKVKSKENKLSATFYAYILQRRAYIGCEPLLYASGYVRSMICFTWYFPKGAYEDFILYISNNHPVLACIYAAKGGPLSRSGRRLVYTMQYSLAFFIKIMAYGVFQYMNFSMFLLPVFSILCITPLSVSFGILIRNLYTCSFLVDNHNFRVENPKLYRWVKWIGRLVALQFVVGVVGLLLLASTFSCEKSRFDTIFSFFLQVQVVSFILEMVYAVLIFTPDYYYNLSITTPFFSKSLVLIGSLYAERLIKNTSRTGSVLNLNDRSLIINTRVYFGGLVRSETLCSRAYALKKGWITENVISNDLQATIEMNDVADNFNFGDNDAVFLDDSEFEHTTDRSSVFTTSNPLLDPSYIKSKSLKATDTLPPPRPLPPVTVMIPNNVETNTNQLYEAYMNEVSQKERSTLSFEEWKMNRKRFKENTRQSFIAAYNNIADLIEGRTNEALRDKHIQEYHKTECCVEGTSSPSDTGESNVKNMIRRFSVLPASGKE